MDHFAGLDVSVKDTSVCIVDPWKRRTEIALAGWGGRIRTSEWRNQNPLSYHLAASHRVGDRADDRSQPDRRRRKLSRFRRRGCNC